MQTSNAERRHGNVAVVSDTSRGVGRGASRGFTLIELLVVVAIVTIIAAIVFPVFSQARGKALQSVCSSNERQLGLSMMQYVQDFDETLPLRFVYTATGTLSWRAMLQPYVKNIAVFQCPTDPDNDMEDGDHDGVNASYVVPRYDSGPGGAFRDGGITDPLPVAFSVVQAPATVLLVVESKERWSEAHIVNPAPDLQTPPNQRTTNNGCLFTGHAGLQNMLFCDGHVKSLHLLDTVGTDEGGSGSPGVNMWIVNNADFVSASDDAAAIANLAYGANHCQ